MEETKKQILDLLKANVKREGIEKLINYLEASDFFTAPASTRFHCNYEGGLAEHSLNVYNNLINLTKELGFSDETLTICALLHDICKTFFYTVDYRNKKDENGNWVKEPYYTVKDEMPLGHGEKSCLLISEFIKLTKEELYAIRWHMGLGEPKENYNYMSDAFNKYPLAVYLHVADLMSTYITETKGGENK
jgi:hypothetical protein